MRTSLALLTGKNKMKKAVILLSGGLDSATCLAVAKSQDYDCYTLSFDYGQKHHSELQASAKISQHYQASQHEVVSLSIGSLGGSALTDETIDVPNHHMNSPSIPTTYVPARNTTFLSIALGWAEIIAAEAIFIGVSAVDYSGYPDCRPEYIEAYQQLANLATKTAIEGKPIRIETPLIDLNKAETIQLGIQHGVDYSMTVSCYQADNNGLACGNCDSCALRKKGFQQANIVDPTRYAAKVEQAYD